MPRGQYRVSFSQPARVWGTNEERRMHYLARADLVSRWKEAVVVHWRMQTSRARNIGPSIIRITLPFKEMRTRDPANYCGSTCKAIIDGLVLAGAWPDDNPLYVSHFEPLLVIDKDLQVHIDIRPRDQDWEALFS